MYNAANVAVCFMPIEVLPSIYHYGYAMPFYNVSGAVRTILFGTKNEREYLSSFASVALQTNSF